jgi:type IV pilus assembly protein PilF
MKTVFALLAFVLLLSGCGSTGTTTSPDPGAEAATQRNPAAAEATRNVGEAYLAGGNLVAALRELKKAELLNPDDPITLFDIGLVYYYRGRYEQAIE